MKRISRHPKLPGRTALGLKEIIDRLENHRIKNADKEIRLALAELLRPIQLSIREEEERAESFATTGRARNSR